MYDRISAGTPVVQKYGGTSVGSVERIRAVAARVARLHGAGQRRLAVVVSAMAGETNRLVGLVNDTNPEASGRSYDMAVAAGEQVSVALLSAALEREGVPGAPLLAYQLGIFTDELHAKARIRTIATDRIRHAWEEGRVPVIAGFQGITPTGDLTTLGRGGSDTSAVALAVALDAGFCEINTDVDGVYTADPRYVPTARLIEALDYEVALEMASLGSKVLHPRCVELGAKYRLPLVVRNSFKPDGHVRTCIMAQANSDQPIESLVVSGVTLDRDVAKVTVFGLSQEGCAVSDIFAKMAVLGVNVDIIIHDAPHRDKALQVGFTVNGSDVTTVEKGLAEIRSSGRHPDLEFELKKGFAKVSTVGVGMRSYSGVAGRTFQALARENIDIQMISTSEIKISVVVGAEEGERAVQALHDEFVKQPGDAK